PGLGVARDQAPRDRVPAASAGLPPLRRHDLRGPATRRARGSSGAAAGGVRRAADGLLPPEQAAHRALPGGAAEATLLPWPGPQDAGASDPSAAAGLRRTGRCLAVTTAPGDRRVADQGSGGEVLAVDVRRRLFTVFAARACAFHPPTPSARSCEKTG